MTEEEKQQSLAYLHGKVDALQNILEALINQMPEITLYSVLRTARQGVADTAKRRDADKTHQRYDMAMRSHYPPVETPAVTLRATGALNIYDPTVEWLEERIREFGEGASIGNIAMSSQGVENLNFVKQMHEEDGEPYP